jgi:hypothetical protein
VYVINVQKWYTKCFLRVNNYKYGEGSNYAEFWKEVTGFKRVQYSLRWEKKPRSTSIARNLCVLRYGQYSCDLCSRYFIRFPWISTQLSALRHTQVSTLSKTPGFTRISRRAFSARGCNTLIDVEYTRSIRCPHSHNSRGLCRPVDWVSASYPLSTKSRIQMLSGSAAKMSWCPIMREPRVLSLVERHMFQQ